MVTTGKTTQLPSWLGKADRVYAQAGLERGRFENDHRRRDGSRAPSLIARAGGVWVDLGPQEHKAEIPLRWCAAWQLYTGDRSDGPVSLVERECPSKCDKGKLGWIENGPSGKLRSATTSCDTCSTFGGTGKVYEVVRDVEIPLTPPEPNELGEFIEHATSLDYVAQFYRFEIDERECRARFVIDGSGWKCASGKVSPTGGATLKNPDKPKDCPTCNGTGKRPAASYTVERKEKERNDKPIAHK